MMWWNHISFLKRQLKDVQNELEKEQGKAARQAGFVRRLQAFGVSALGQIPRQEFAEALLDSVHELAGADRVVLLKLDPETLDFVPAAARGFAPETLSKL